VEVAVEAIPLVEAARPQQRFAPGRHAVALNRVGVPARDLIEVLEIRGRKAPGPREPNGAVLERARERREEVAGELDRAIELQHEATARRAQERVAGGPLAKITVGEERLDARSEDSRGGKGA